MLLILIDLSTYTYLNLAVFKGIKSLITEEV